MNGEAFAIERMYCLVLALRKESTTSTGSTTAGKGTS